MKDQMIQNALQAFLTLAGIIIFFLCAPFDVLRTLGNYTLGVFYIGYGMIGMIISISFDGFKLTRVKWYSILELLLGLSACLLMYLMRMSSMPFKVSEFCQLLLMVLVVLLYVKGIKYITQRVK